MGMRCPQQDTGLVAKGKGPMEPQTVGEVMTREGFSGVWQSICVCTCCVWWGRGKGEREFIGCVLGEREKIKAPEAAKGRPSPCSRSGASDSVSDGALPLQKGRLDAYTAGVMSLEPGCPFLGVSIISRKRGEARAQY